MIRQAWRIVKEKYAASAFDGEGAARTGGRWNSRGTWLVYVSATRSLAALETLVHLNPPLAFRYLVIPIQFEESLVEKVDLRTLPPNWREQPAPPATRTLGDRWVRDRRSAVLEIPSVVVPEESNFLLNPAHPDFSRITLGQPIPFAFDPRLL